MFLDSNRKLSLVLTTAATTLNMPVDIDYVDITTTTTSPAPFNTYTSGTTPIDILPAPAASTTRKVNSLTIYNRDTVAKTIRVYKVDATPTTGLITAGAFVVGNDYQIVSVGTTNFTLIGASANTVGVIFTATGAGTGTGTAATCYQQIDLQINVDDSLCYTDVQGWYAVDSQGNLKSVQAASATSIATAIHGTTDKTTPIGADEFGIWDSVTGLLTKVSFTNALNWFAAKFGNAANVFSVAPATAAAHAVRSDQLSADNTNFPIYTVPTAYTPTVSAQIGTYTTASATAKWTKFGKTYIISFVLTITTNGTATTAAILTLPAGVIASGDSFGIGRETAVTGNALCCRIADGATAIFIQKYDGTYVGANGYVLEGTITLNVA